MKRKKENHKIGNLLIQKIPPPRISPAAPWQARSRAPASEKHCLTLQAPAPDPKNAVPGFCNPGKTARGCPVPSGALGSLRTAPLALRNTRSAGFENSSPSSTHYEAWSQRNKLVTGCPVFSGARVASPHVETLMQISPLSPTHKKFTRKFYHIIPNQ